MNDRGAVLIGEKTLGKGRTQRAVPLSDGSVLLLSNLRFTTPARTPVDKVSGSLPTESYKVRSWAVFLACCRCPDHSGCSCCRHCLCRQAKRGHA